MRITNDFLVKDSFFRGLIGSWKDFLNTASNTGDVKLLQLHERTGRPLGDDTFIEKLEFFLKINLKKKRAGRRKKEK